MSMMINVDICCDTEDEFWDIKDRLQTTVRTTEVKEVTVYSRETGTTHFFVPRELEEGKYVYYEKEAFCAGHVNPNNMEI